MIVRAKVLNYLACIIVILSFGRNNHVKSNEVERVMHYGTPLSISKVPWQVSLYDATRNGDQFICGGSIIGPNEVLTAAHCVDNSTSLYYIRAGSAILNKDGTLHNVERIFIHKHWYRTAARVDLALIRVRESFNFRNRYIKPIRLSTREPRNGEMVLVAGWGKTESKEPIHKFKHLEGAKVAAWDKNKCYYKFRATVMYKEGNDKVCISNSHRHTLEAVDEGDSGSPVVMNNFLVGVVYAKMKPYEMHLNLGVRCGVLSDGEEICDGTKKISIYTSILPHMAWINNAFQLSRHHGNWIPDYTYSAR